MSALETLLMVEVTLTVAAMLVALLDLPREVLESLLEARSWAAVEMQEAKS